MAEELDLEINEFLDNYATESIEDGVYEMLEVESRYGSDCILLERDEETGLTLCRAHGSRPTQCRTWPFWPENLRNRDSWRRAGENCEGIGRGRLIPLRVIQNELRATPEWGTPR